MHVKSKPNLPRLTLVFLSLITIANCAIAQVSFENEIVIVNFDDQSATALSSGPNRAIFSAVIDKLRDAGAKAIVLKYFLDTPTNEKNDSLLETSLKSSRVLLQATINDAPPVSKTLNSKFEFSGTIRDVKPRVSGLEGWLPLERYQQYAAQVCFVDVPDLHAIPLLEIFNGKAVKSLYACILEEVLGHKLDFVGPDYASFGEARVPVNRYGEVPVTLSDLGFPKYISVASLIKSNHHGDSLRNKIVVISYSGARSPTVEVDGKPVIVHQVFLAGLRELLSRVSKSSNVQVQHSEHSGSE